MRPFELTHKAKADLRANAIFTEERWGIEQRNTYIKQFDEAFTLLRPLPCWERAATTLCRAIENFLKVATLSFTKTEAIP